MVFNNDIFGNIRRKKQVLEKRITGIQKSLERVDSPRLVYLEQQLQKDYDTILFQEEFHWFQNSREKWINLGNKNIKNFHTQTVIRRKRNNIHGLHLPNGV